MRIKRDVEEKLKKEKMMLKNFTSLYEQDTSEKIVQKMNQYNNNINIFKRILEEISCITFEIESEIYKKKFNIYTDPLTNELLDVIRKGFTVENFGKPNVIHAHAAKGIKIRPGNVNLVSAIKDIELMNNYLKPDKQFNIIRILNYFMNSKVLTPKACRCLITDYDKFEVDDDNVRFVNWRILVNILKYHANGYYNEHFQ